MLGDGGEDKFNQDTQCLHQSLNFFFQFSFVLILAGSWAQMSHEYEGD